jgi:predicted sulfurtransferase
MSFLKFMLSMGKTKEIGSLTDFLVSNPMFRHFALKTHKNKQTMFQRMEQYLDKELLGVETKKTEKPLELNTRGRNQTGGVENDYQKKH